MKYRVYVEICNKSNACRELVDLFISNDRNRALYQFIVFSETLDRLMRSLEEGGERSDIDQLVIVIDLQENGISIASESLSYQEYKKRKTGKQEYRMAMDMEEDEEDDR